jgi:hypothetical protein
MTPASYMYSYSVYILRTGEIITTVRQQYRFTCTRGAELAALEANGGQRQDEPGRVHSAAVDAFCSALPLLQRSPLSPQRKFEKSKQRLRGFPERAEAYLPLSSWELGSCEWRRQQIELNPQVSWTAYAEQSNIGTLPLLWRTRKACGVLPLFLWVGGCWY